MSDQPASMAEVLRRSMARALSDVHTCMPAKVVKVTLEGANIKSVDVQPLIQVAHLDETLQRVVETLPVIVNVPIQWFAGGGFRVTVPIKVDDVGTIKFAEAALDTWLSRGGVVDPLDDRRCSLTDAIYSPGLYSFANPLKSTPNDRMTIGDDAGLQIHIDGGKVKIGSNVDLEVDAVALANPVKTWMGQAAVAFANHTHPSPAGATGVAVGALPSAPSDLASTAVFAKK